MDAHSPATLATALQHYFGFNSFRPGQQAVMERLLAGGSAAAVFPTGSGKSLCYQLPALLLPGVTLVVSPLIALMKDQIDALTARGIAARRLDSTLTLEEHREVMQRVRAGDLRLLYVAPERFQNERFRELLRQIRVSLFAVDEAHCISEWGHNFRPDYLKLVEFSRQCQAERVLALTATATPQVLDDICRAFHIDHSGAIRTGFYRPNLTLLTTPAEAAARDGLLEQRLRDRTAGPTIIYVSLQKTAESVAARLTQLGFDARAYHAGMEDEERGTVQDWFFSTGNPIVVATIAFGMGIDKANIRYVYHYNLPKSLENYAQEIGRAGRDGLASTCEMLIDLTDLQVLENFAYGDTPTRQAVEQFVAEIFSLPVSLDVSFSELSSRHDIRQLVVRTLLTYLELEGYLAGGTPFYSSYKVRALSSSASILARFEGERRDFLRKLFGQFRKAITWMTVDVPAAAAAIGSTRDRIIRALDYLAEQGWIELQTMGVRNRYERLRSPADLSQLAATLFEKVTQREQSEITRLHQVVELIEHDGCQVARLGQHFGEEPQGRCGHCNWCLGEGQRVTLPPRQVQPVEPSVWHQARALQEQFEILREPRVLTRFLCGLSSPALTKNKLTRQPLFGVCSEVPFREVEQMLASPLRN
ncbi:MAG: ATP-dependent DNA helicase RecQ [Planctomycetota bacterium]